MPSALPVIQTWLDGVSTVGSNSPLGWANTWGDQFDKTVVTGTAGVGEVNVWDLITLAEGRFADALIRLEEKRLVPDHDGLNPFSWPEFDAATWDIWARRDNVLNSRPFSQGLDPIPDSYDNPWEYALVLLLTDVSDPENAAFQDWQNQRGFVYLEYLAVVIRCVEILDGVAPDPLLVTPFRP